jgi:hypothetical protein
MLRWLRAVVVTVLFALLGAAAGRVVAAQRRRMETGEAGPSNVDVALELPKPQEVVPGLVAALRIGDRPWSFLHVPPWLAAFAVNLVVTAMGRELQPLARDLGGESFGWQPEPVTHETIVVNGHAAEVEEPADEEGPARPAEGAAGGFVPFEE